MTNLELTELEERLRWETIILHPKWDGTNDIDYLMKNGYLEDAEDEAMAVDYYEQASEPCDEEKIDIF